MFRKVGKEEPSSWAQPDWKRWKQNRKLKDTKRYRRSKNSKTLPANDLSEDDNYPKKLSKKQADKQMRLDRKKSKQNAISEQRKLRRGEAKTRETTCFDNEEILTNSSEPESKLMLNATDDIMLV